MLRSASFVKSRHMKVWDMEISKELQMWTSLGWLSRFRFSNVVNWDTSERVESRLAGVNNDVMWLWTCYSNTQGEMERSSLIISRSKPGRPPHQSKPLLGIRTRQHATLLNWHLWLFCRKQHKEHTFSVATLLRVTRCCRKNMLIKQCLFS